MAEILTLGFNEIAIEVNAECQTNGWAVNIDSGSIALRPNLTSPIVFIPGWYRKNGYVSGVCTTGIRRWISGIQYTKRRIPEQRHRNDRGNRTSGALFDRARTANQTGAKKVFIVAHSRGGIFVRQTLRMYQSLAPFVAGYLTISTVHDDPISEIYRWCDLFTVFG